MALTYETENTDDVTVLKFQKRSTEDTDVQSFYIKEHPGQDNVTVDEHDAQIEFKCDVYSNTASKTKITFEGNLIKERVNVTSLSVSREDVSCYDAGVFICEGINDNGKISSLKIFVSVRCPDHTNIQGNCQQSEQTALIVGITLGVVCCALACVAFYLNLLRMRTDAKDKRLPSRSKKQSAYANTSFASNVVESHEYENPETVQGEDSNQQQYTDLSRYANTDRDTYDVIRKT